MELKHESITLSSLVRRAGGGVLAQGFLRQTHVLFTAASRVS